MPIVPRYDRLLFSYWVRILTTRLEPEGIRLYEIYQVEEYLDRNSSKYGMAIHKIKAPNGNLVGLMSGESEYVSYDDYDSKPVAPNLPPLKEIYEQ